MAVRLRDVTIAADASMVSAANRTAIEQAGLSFILSMWVPDVPYLIAEWRSKYPDSDIPDGHIFTQPWPAGPTDQRRDQVIYYHYKADRARRSLRGIEQQVTKAHKAVTGQAAVKRNRFVRLSGGERRSTATWKPRPERWLGSKAT